MGTVGIDGKLLSEIIRSRFTAGPDELLNQWQTTLPGTKETDRKTPDRSTVYRWIERQALPRSKDDYLHLCAVLDIDPISLLVASDGDTTKALEHLLTSLQLEHWQQPALSFLSGFFGRQHGWPPAAFVNEYFGRNWHFVDIDHDPAVRANYYATIEIRPDPDVRVSRPQVIHVAFRLPTLFRQRWLEFGVIWRYADETRLFHINGHHGSYTDQDPLSRVETWFGPGAARFRLASIHPFEAALADDPGDFPKLRFPG